MEEAKKRPLWKRILSVVGYVLAGLLVAFAAFSIYVTASSKKDPDGTATVFGRQLRFVQSSSMESSGHVDVSKYKIGSIKVKSCVFVETVPEEKEAKEKWYAALEVGDVLTFKYAVSRQETITHRIVSIAENESKGGYVITLMGDNRTPGDGTTSQTIDTSLDETSPNYVIGKVTGQSYVLGLIIYALKTPVGFCLIIIAPCAAIIVYEVIRIAMVCKKDKQEKALAKERSAQSEIENLKKQLEEMKAKQNDEKEENP